MLLVFFFFDKSIPFTFLVPWAEGCLILQSFTRPIVDIGLPYRGLFPLLH